MDEETVTLTPDDAVREEGDSGVTDFTFTLERSGDLSETTTIDWTAQGAVVTAVVDGRLSASSDDFAEPAPVSGSVTFEAGQESATISVPIQADTEPEIESPAFQNRDVFAVTIEAPDSVAVAEDTAFGEILNDDGRGELLILRGPQSEVTVPFNAEVRGTADAETVRVPDGSTVSFTGGAGDRVAFQQDLSAYEISQSGNVLSVRDADGGAAQVAVNDAMELAFADGTADAAIAANGDDLPEITLGGETVDESFDPAEVARDRADVSALAGGSTQGLTADGLDGL